MKLAADPSIISFAGGMPSNSLFPTNIVDELYNGLSKEAKQTAMQYGPTSGYPPLLDSLRDYLKSKGLPLENQDLLITTGAQQAINLITKVLIDTDDVILTEYPSFIGALAAFKSYGATLEGIAMDQDGIIPGLMEKALKRWGEKVKMAYLCPYFHNPAGITYSSERKKEILALLKNYPLTILEDDPYGELYFDENDKKLTIPMKALAGGAEQDPICYVGSFAKIFGPGMRLGYLLAPTEIIEKCELAKQSQDACTSTFTQVITDAYLRKDKLGGYLEFLRPIYARRAATMLNALKTYMPDGVTWTTPKGGFFIWVMLPENVNASTVFAESLKKGAAFVTGNAFDPQGKRNNCFRLAFSHTAEENIETGIRYIADAIRSVMM